jgi:hypothetical protein
MNKLISHIRANVIAYLALFVALGGTSYAAITIPRNSVGTRQLRNGAVTPAKLDGGLIGASVRAWAEVSSTGYVLRSSVPAHTVQWGTLAADPGFGVVDFDRPVISSGCFAITNVEAYGPAVFGASANAVVLGDGPDYVRVDMEGSSDSPATVPVLILVLCPS